MVIRLMKFFGLIGWLNEAKWSDPVMAPVVVEEERLEHSVVG